MKYSIVLEGKNFEVMIDGEEANLGFYTTRILMAETIEEAENMAIDLVWNDEVLKEIMVKNRRFEPKLEIEGVYKAKWWKRVGSKGYSFFPMDS